ncbi:hypothetical protein [Blastococcus sp. SYSU DS0539]
MVVLPCLAAGSAAREADRVRAELAEAVRGPVVVGSTPPSAGVRTGASCFPADADDVAGLLVVADRAAGRLPAAR